MKPLSALILAALFLPLTTACDKACDYKIREQAKIRNYTGSPLSLSVCKGFGQPPQQIEVPGDEVNIVSLGQGERTKVVGGPATMAACPAYEHSSENVSFALTNESFGQVKLCSSDTIGDYAVVNAYDVCPDGTREQTVPASCDSTPANY